MVTGRLQPTTPAPDAKAIARGLAGNVGARVSIEVTIPRTEIKARMRLVARTEAMAIKAEARRLFKGMNLVDDGGKIVGVAADDWSMELAVRFLSVAVRDPTDMSKPLDSLEEWRECDDDQIEALWSDYVDLRAQVDPLGDGALELSDAELGAIEAAVKKKESAILMSFGSRRLASYILTSAAQPAS